MRLINDIANIMTLHVMLKIFNKIIIDHAINMSLFIHHYCNYTQNLIEFFNLIHLEFKVFFGMMYSKTTKSIQVSPQSYGLFRRMQSPRILKYNFKLQPHTIFVVWNFNIKFSFMKFISSKCIYVLLFVHYFVCLLDVCVIA